MKSVRMYNVTVNTCKDGSGEETTARTVGFVDRGEPFVSLQIEENEHLCHGELVPDPVPAPDGWENHVFSPDEARQLAEALLCAADDAECEE